MKISAEQAQVMVRILERYYIYTDRFMTIGFSAHPESLRNKNLFLEAAEDLNLIASLYPAFSGGRSIHDGVGVRVQNSKLPDPKDNKQPLVFPEIPEVLDESQTDR